MEIQKIKMGAFENRQNYNITLVLIILVIIELVMVTTEFYFNPAPETASITCPAGKCPKLVTLSNGTKKWICVPC